MNTKLLYLLVPLVFSRCLGSMPHPVPSQDTLNEKLRLAASLGKTSEMIDLLEKGAEISSCDEYGRTALMTAADYGHIDCVNALIKAKADVSIRDRENDTALHMAAWNGRVDCVKALIKANAFINEVGSFGFTPFYQSAQFDYIDCIKELLKSSYLLVPSTDVVSASRKRIFNALLQFVWIRKQYPELDNLKADSLQFEILSWNKLLSDDLVIILLDELKKGKEIKGVALIRSKEAAVSYLLKKILEISPEAAETAMIVMGSATRALFESNKLNENFGALVRAGLDERIELLKVKEKKALVENRATARVVED